jgi:hypothetical protein
LEFDFAFISTLLLHSSSDTVVARSNVFTVAEVLSQMVRLLQVQDISVNLCCLDVLRLLAIEPDTVKALGGLGLYDILDSIQVTFHA